MTMADPETCLEVFKSHWQQACMYMTHNHGRTGIAPQEEVSTVLHYVDQMMLLMVEEQPGVDGAQGPILQYVLEGDIIKQMIEWIFNESKDNQERLQFHFLKSLEMLIAQAEQKVLLHKPVLKPLLELLSRCSATQGGLSCDRGDHLVQCSQSERVEQHVVLLLHQLCVTVTRQTELLELLFNATLDHGPARFLIFSLLIPYIHREGGVGQQARDALLLIMALSAKNQDIGRYIAKNSDFCPVLATGLSGLYSSLPSKVDPPYDDWHQLQPDDVNKCTELVMFLNSLGFCNAVVQAAHPDVAQQLQTYIYHGFLVSVMGPALHQSSLEEVIAATAYLDLFLRSITEPALLFVFVKFILCEKFDDTYILESLVSRIHSSTRLCMVTLTLLHTLISLNSEDVMFQLVFRYLIPCNHVMVSQRRAVGELDVYSKTAEKLLGLRPSCCLKLYSTDSSHLDSQYKSHDVGMPYATSSLAPVETHDTSYADYLLCAQTSLQQCAWATNQWVARYDGEDPAQDSSVPAQDQGKDGITQVQDTGPSGLPSSRPSEGDTDQADGSLSHNRPDTSCSFEADQPSSGNSTENDDMTRKRTTSIDLNQTNTTDSGCVNDSHSMSSPGRESTEEKLNDKELGDCHMDETGDESTSCDTSPSKSSLGPPNTAQPQNKGEVGPEASHSSGSLHKCGGSPINMAHASVDISVFMLTLKKMEEPEDAESTDLEQCMSEIDSMASDLLQLAELKKASQSNFSLSLSSSFSMSLNLSSPSPMWEVEEGPREDKQEVQSPIDPLKLLPGKPDIGPFLTALLQKLDCMIHNSLYVNLLLTGLVSRLACYPQPLLRSFLLNHTLVFQPTVKSLLQVLGSIKHKVDSYSFTVHNFHELLSKARHFLSWRDEVYLYGKTRKVSTSSQAEPPVPVKATKRKSIGDFFRRNLTPKKTPNRVQLNSSGVRYINRLPSPDDTQDPTENLKTKNAVYCALVLDEFLKELAAISQEHAALHQSSITFAHSLEKIVGF